MNGHSTAAAGKEPIGPTPWADSKPSPRVGSEKPGPGQGIDPEFWDLRLYVAGHTPKCLAAFARLNELCEEHLAGKYHIEVVDLLENPRLAQEDEILAIPTLVRRLPAPLRKIIGDLSDSQRTLVGLQLRPRPL